MGLILLTILLSGIFAAVVAFPAINKREARPPRFSAQAQVEIVQTLDIGSTHRNTKSIGGCFRLFDKNVPTKIELLPNAPGRYYIEGFSSEDCSDVVPLIRESSGAIINARTPICSLKLKNNPQSIVTVELWRKTTVKKFTITNQTGIYEICQSSPYHKYAERVFIQTGNGMDNEVNLFEDSNASFPIKLGVRSGADLVDLTLKQTQFVRSLRIVGET